MKRTVVLLSGWKGSGKDYVADILVDQFLFTKTAFANPLKDAVSEIYRVPRKLLDTQEGKKKIYQITSKFTVTYRDLLIKHGEEKRNININHWSHQVYTQLLNSQCNFVISDWRFPHELDYLKSNLPDINFIPLRIHRNLINTESDPTETSLDDFDFDLIIDNTKDNDIPIIISQIQKSIKKQSLVITT